MAREAPFGLDQNIYDEYVADARFSYDHLLKAPCFWWPKLKENEILNELIFESSRNWPDVVFCEDLSQFRHFSPHGEAAEPMEFATEFEGSLSRRYASLVPSRSYSPKSRLTR